MYNGDFLPNYFENAGLGGFCSCIKEWLLLCWGQCLQREATREKRRRKLCRVTRSRCGLTTTSPPSPSTSRNSPAAPSTGRNGFLVPDPTDPELFISVAGPKIFLFAPAPTPDSCLKLKLLHLQQILKQP
jgi:hypothetical protein